MKLLKQEAVRLGRPVKRSPELQVVSRKRTWMRDPNSISVVICSLLPAIAMEVCAFGAALSGEGAWWPVIGAIPVVGIVVALKLNGTKWIHAYPEGTTSFRAKAEHGSAQDEAWAADVLNRKRHTT